MPATTAPVQDSKPSNGLVALLKAMGLAAVQVSPDVVALQARPSKR